MARILSRSTKCLISWSPQRIPSLQLRKVSYKPPSFSCRLLLVSSDVGGTNSTRVEKMIQRLRMYARDGNTESNAFGGKSQIPLRATCRPSEFIFVVLWGTRSTNNDRHS
ncbi:hypothetical protein AMTR_s00014p00087840 [Amborella trichopoda]|uniref:Uncharacterized protein n=1 Tax=Amborella trichopoda TaxID=13333 RepID=W1PN11_AMBTC|nr:hypothetical protein AMTR_s00014p00087840 [Amborella trichopoda]